MDLMRMVQRELPAVEERKETLPGEAGPPYEWAALSCGAAVVALAVMALTGHSAWVWGPAVGLIPPLQVLGLLLGWHAIRGPRGAVGLGWTAVALNLLAIAIGALLVVTLREGGYPQAM